jgi:hypothetical protein
MWTIERVEKLGFKLIASEKMWCHFRGHGFDVHINLNTKECQANLFNFKSYKNSFKGNFRAQINTEQEFNELLRMIK